MERGYADGEARATVRLFVAIPVPDDVAERASRAIRELRRIEEIRWIPPESWHLTVRFLGSVGAGRVEPIAATLRDTLAETAAFPLRLAGAGAFPSPARARVVWIGADGGPALDAVHRHATVALDRLGFAPETRPFTPHVTIGRVRRGARPSGLPGLLPEAAVDESFEVSALALMRSELRPDGARYTGVAAVPLAG